MYCVVYFPYLLFLESTSSSVTTEDLQIDVAQDSPASKGIIERTLRCITTRVEFCFTCSRTALCLVRSVAYVVTRDRPSVWLLPKSASTSALKCVFSCYTVVPYEGKRVIS